MKRTEKRVGWGSDMVKESASRDEEVAPDLIMFSGFGNVTAAVTDEGIVIIDLSSRNYGSEIVKRLRVKTQAPIHTIIYTHGHLDHVGGVGAFMEDARERGDPKPRIIAQELLPKRFNRYQELGGFQIYLNMIQYGRLIDRTADLDLEGRQFLAPDIPYPDVTFNDAMHFRLGGLTFELYHSMGETDDNIWVYIPERKTVVAGDAVKGGMPNIGNPFKLLLRYEVEWAEAMERIAGKNPDFLIPGHGRVLHGPEIQEICLGQAKFLRIVHDEVIRLLNKGYWLEDILEMVKVPEELLNKPYLSQVYGSLNFVIHGIYYRYAGWYNGKPSEMLPAKPSEIAAEVVQTCGVGALMERVKKLQQEGKIQLALNVIDFIVNGADDKSQRKEALKLKAILLDARAAIETNGMAKNTFLRGAEAADHEANSM